MRRVDRCGPAIGAAYQTVTGKVQKFKMRQAAIEQFGLGETAAITTA